MKEQLNVAKLSRRRGSERGTEGHKGAQRGRFFLCPSVKKTSFRILVARGTKRTVPFVPLFLPLFLHL